MKSVDDAKTAAAEFLKRGCKNVVITLGEMGALIVESEGPTTHIPAPKVTVTDTTVSKVSDFLTCSLDTYVYLSI